MIPHHMVQYSARNSAALNWLRMMHCAALWLQMGGLGWKMSGGDLKVGWERAVSITATRHALTGGNLHSNFIPDVD
ncbi:hypothetical protein EVAR_85713_1 [Eumeta japonica]|uniref:Uncharacterized protein n=1 Tax=Eumeta variegata TaxID=151549 RepID=A0A4C1Y693_EUMVA|nr:hypothetical protein EVAR_85713_1 [Eumeta japonica]